MAQEPAPADVDLVNRDPNNLNDHVKVGFEDVLAEPGGAHSMDCVWINSYKCFNCCQGCCYNILTLFSGICIAMELGCNFAFITFVHVWYITPCLRIFMINCGCAQKFFGSCLQCCLAPVCETCALILGNIVVKNI